MKMSVNYLLLLLFLCALCSIHASKLSTQNDIVEKKPADHLPADFADEGGSSEEENGGGPFDGNGPLPRGRPGIGASIGGGGGGGFNGGIDVNIGRGLGIDARFGGGAGGGLDGHLGFGSGPTGGGGLQAGVADGDLGGGADASGGGTDGGFGANGSP